MRARACVVRSRHVDPEHLDPVSQVAVDMDLDDRGGKRAPGERSQAACQYRSGVTAKRSWSGDIHWRAQFHRPLQLQRYVTVLVTPSK